MPCERFRRALARHAAGAVLDPGASAHLEVCPACRQTLAAQRAALSEVDRELACLADLAAPAGFAARVQANTSAPSRTAWWRVRPLAAAYTAAVILAVVCLVLWMPERRQPVEAPVARSAAEPVPGGRALPVERPAVASAEHDAADPSPSPSRRRPRRAGSRAGGQAEPEVIVPRDRALALQRLQEMLAAGTLTADRLPPEPQNTDLTVAPLEIPELSLADGDAPTGDAALQR